MYSSTILNQNQKKTKQTKTKTKNTLLLLIAKFFGKEEKYMTKKAGWGYALKETRRLATHIL